jgi:hypothetical protein
MASQPSAQVSHTVAVEFSFAFDPAFRLAALPFGVTPSRAGVVVEDDTFRASFGPWVVETPLANIEGAEVTGPYPLPKVIGPPHLSMKDRGLTFASNARQGVCVRFRDPVPGLLANDWIRHPALTVTVAEAPELAELLDRQRHAERARKGEDVHVEDLVDEVHDDLAALTASELRDRARARGIEGISSMRKRELIEALSVPSDGS